MPDVATGLRPPGIDVAAGLVFRRGKVLITQRHADAHLGGLWEFPGGKRHFDESFEQCLQRELLEELGIEVKVKELVEAITHEYPEKTVHLRFFRCAWLHNEPKTIGCQSLAWVGADQLEAYTFPPADAQLLKKLSCSPRLWYK